MDGDSVKSEDVQSTEGSEIEKSIEIEVGGDKGDTDESGPAADTPTVPENGTSSPTTTLSVNTNLSNGLDLADRASITPTSTSQIDDDCVIFHNISYLGASFIQEPKSEKGIKEIMAFLNAESNKVIRVSVSVPLQSNKHVIVYEEENQLEVVRFGVNQIIFFARGVEGSSEGSCFAFTCAHGEFMANSIIQCNVFKCELQEQVARIFKSFARAFENPPRMPYRSPSECHTPSNSTESSHNSADLSARNTEEFAIFEVTLEIKESDEKGHYSGVKGDKEKGFFRLRSCVNKQISLCVQQVPNGFSELIVERCFGLLLSPGRHIRASDMQLIEMLSWSIGSNSSDRKNYVITGHWDSGDPAFESLNVETDKDSCIFFTTAVDLVLKGIREPIRFALESKAKIYRSSGGGLYQMIGRKHSFTQQFRLVLRKVEDYKVGGPLYEVVNTIPLGEVDRSKANFNLNFTSFIRSASIPSLDGEMLLSKEEDESDDEPLPSGMGEISKYCTDEQLEAWSQIVSNWSPKTARPKHLNALIKELGIPNTIRGEIWQRLSDCQNDVETMDTYRTLLNKTCTNEETILRDINRTFPANDFFLEGGQGQELLFKISKCYALYDSEVGYCQGISFIGAALLLQMPEEQAFCLLVKIMYAYGFRDLFRDGFDQLHSKLYQINRLIQDQLPELHAHFEELGIESHMWASQWFLTLYTAKFPLPFVFRVIDLFLLDGSKVLFQMAIALLLGARKDLLVLDFEGILKYFRVNLPKKYRSPENIQTLFKSAIQVKVKRLKKYEAEYLALKEQEKNYVDPIAKLKTDNKRLMEDILRYDYALTNLVLQKATADESVASMSEEIARLKETLADTDNMNQSLMKEAISVKELFQRELRNYDEEAEKKQKIIADYKNICSKLSRQIEEEQRLGRERMSFFQTNSCEQCRTFVSTVNNLIVDGTKAEGGGNSPTHSGSSASTPTSTPSINMDATQLENELAKTKIALAEAECKNDDLGHQLAVLHAELEATRGQSGSGPSWFFKNFTKNRISTEEQHQSSNSNLNANNPNSNTG